MLRCIRGALAAVLLACLLLTGCGGGEAGPEETELLAEATETGILLRWKNIEGADRYRLLRRSGDSPDFHFVCDVRDGIAFTDTFVQQGEAYTYRLKVMRGSRELALGESAPVSLVEPPRLLLLRQLDGDRYQADWNERERECVLYGQQSGGWTELGRSRNGSLGFENTGHCTAVAVASAGEDLRPDDAVPLPVSGTIRAVTRLDGWTCVIELDAPEEDGRFELARAEREEGPYTVVGSGGEHVFYDRGDRENAEYWYRVRFRGERSEGAWSAPAAIGTGDRRVFYVPVMMYHEFLAQEDLEAGAAPEEYAISPEDFEHDLLWLRDHGYTTVTTAALADYLEGRGSLPEKPIILSIDEMGF